MGGGGRDRNMRQEFFIDFAIMSEGKSKRFYVILRPIKFLLRAHHDVS